MWVAIPVAMLAGLLSFLSPCVLPLVPGYLGFISGAVAPVAREGDAGPSTSSGTAGAIPGSVAGSDAAGTAIATGTPTVARSRLVLGVLLFILGFSVVFIAFSIVGGAAGAFFLVWGDLLTRIFGVLIILMGLVFLGLFGFAQRNLRFQVNSRTGLIGAPLLGVALGIGWAPCMGPTLTAIMAMSWNLGDPWRASLLGLAYSLGLGIPFLLIALGFNWATRTVGFLRRHIRVVNIIGGVLLILLGLLMVTGLWTEIMSKLGAVMISVELPL
nr:cytochrome c biogenesis protein CcdA [Microbacterium sp. NIBRBAC000506063]